MWTTEQITALVREAIERQDRGDVVLAGETLRTLDDMIGRWIDGRFVGGAALVRVARMHRGDWGRALRAARV